MRSPWSAFLNQHSYVVIALGVLVVAASVSALLRPRLRVALIGGGVAIFAAVFAVLRIGSGDLRAPGALDPVLGKGQPVVIEFYSNYCIACLGAKPAFDELEREFRGRAAFLRADVQSEAGGALMSRYAIDTVPTFLVFDRGGRLLLQREGNPGVPERELRQALNSEGP